MKYLLPGTQITRKILHLSKQEYETQQCYFEIGENISLLCNIPAHNIWKCNAVEFKKRHNKLKTYISICICMAHPRVSTCSELLGY